MRKDAKSLMRSPRSANFAGCTKSRFRSAFHRHVCRPVLGWAMQPALLPGYIWELRCHLGGRVVGPGTQEPFLAVPINRSATLEVLGESWMYFVHVFNSPSNTIVRIHSSNSQVSECTHRLEEALSDRERKISLPGYRYGTLTQFYELHQKLRSRLLPSKTLDLRSRRRSERGSAELPR